MSPQHNLIHMTTTELSWCLRMRNQRKSNLSFTASHLVIHFRFQHSMAKLFTQSQIVVMSIRLRNLFFIIHKTRAFWLWEHGSHFKCYLSLQSKSESTITQVVLRIFIISMFRVTVSNTIQFNAGIHNIHFSLCGQFIFIPLDTTYSTYAVSPDHQSLTLVNQFHTSYGKHIAWLGNDRTVVVCVDRRWCWWLIMKLLLFVVYCPIWSACPIAVLLLIE